MKFQTSNFSSRNLDYQSNTGINKYKLITFFDIDDGAATRRQYATLGFTYGPGALAGQVIAFFFLNSIETIF